MRVGSCLRNPRIRGGELYSFRLPFRLPRRARLGLTAEQFFLEHTGERRVWLRGRDNESQPLCEATSVVLRGEGYESEAEAAREGERWRDVVSRAQARAHLAADFGDRMPYGMLSEAGEAEFALQFGHPVLGEAPGVTVFVDQPGLRFVAVHAEGCLRPAEERNRDILEQAAQSADSMDARERVAFDLYSGSFFQPSADSRLLMLTMAVETLLSLQPRSEVVQDHVQAMIMATEANTGLTRAEVDSLKGSLMWLRSESIGQAGRRLARTLEPRRYGGIRPEVLFTRCYEMRSALTHGKTPRPDRMKVDRLAANLEGLVGDLLAGPLLHQIPD